MADQPSEPDRLPEQHAGSGLPRGPDAPLVPRFPIRFQDVLVLTAFYRTEPAAIARLVPAPLRPIGDIVAVHTYRMRDVERMGALGECNVMVGAELPRGSNVLPGGFTVAQFVTSDVGLAHGREVHGQPKKLARITLETRDDLLLGVVERNGIDIITTTLPYKEKAAEPKDLLERFDFTLNFNLKMILGIDGTPAIWELTSRRLADIEYQGCWTGPCTVELRPNANAPVWRLPVIEALDGFLWQTAFRLVGGERVYDYLAEGPGADD